MNYRMARAKNVRFHLSSFLSGWHLATANRQQAELRVALMTP